MRKLVLGFASVAYLVACENVRPVSDAATVHDSASIRITESSSPAWNDDGWRVLTPPEITIGTATGDSTALFQVRGAIRLNERIYVALESAQQIWVFDENGTRVRRIGRPGQGPGEFNGLGAIYRYLGDSILAYDFPLRLAVFDADGNLGRTVMLSPLEGGRLGILLGPLSDGSLVMSAAPRHGQEMGLVRNTMELWRVSAEGVVGEQMLTLPGREIFYSTSPDGRLDFRAPFFGQTTYTALGPSYIVAGMTDSYELRRYEADGLLSIIMRRMEPTRDIDPAAVDALIERRASTVDDPNVAREVRQFYRDMPAGRHVPAFGTPSWGERVGDPLIVDDPGNIWIAEYPTLGEEENIRAVFAPTGAWLGTVRFPPRFAPTHIGDDFVLGVWRDDQGIEYVHQYALEQ